MKNGMFRRNFFERALSVAAVGVASTDADSKQREEPVLEEVYFPFAKQRSGWQEFLDLKGLPVSYGKVHTYDGDSKVRKTTYSDTGKTKKNPNPIPLDAMGKASIYGDGDYKVVVEASNGKLIWAINKLFSDADECPKILSNATGAENIGFGDMSVAAALSAGVRRIGYAASLLSDIAPYLKEKVDSFNGKAGTLVFDPQYTYKQRSTVSIPFNVSIDFNYANIIPMTGGDFVDGFMYYLNMDLSGNQLDKSDIIHSGPFITGVRFTNEETIPNMRGFRQQSKHSFESLYFMRFSQMIRKTGRFNAQYIDRLSYKRIENHSPRGDDWSLDIQYYGDGLEIESYHHAGDANNLKGIRVKNCNGGRICNIINGSVLLEDCSALSLSSLHHEYGSISLVSSSATISDVFQWHRPDLGLSVPLKISGKSNDMLPPQSSIKNYRIVHYPPKKLLIEKPDISDYWDAEILQGATVKIENFKRYFFSPPDPALGYESVVKISTDGKRVDAQWDDVASLAGKECVISSGAVIPTIKTVYLSMKEPSVRIDATTHAKWNEDSGLYYYKIAVLIPPKSREIGRLISKELIHDTGLDSKIPVIHLGEIGDGLSVANIRIYRGRHPGVYNHYVDLAIGSAAKFYDLGFYLGTAERWKTRPAGGPEDFYSEVERVDIHGLNVHVYASALPSKAIGSYVRGDRITCVRDSDDFYVEYLHDGSGWRRRKS